MNAQQYITVAENIMDTLNTEDRVTNEQLGISIQLININIELSKAKSLLNIHAMLQDINSTLSR
ncbi:MAG: hypothetical protein DRI46_12150 [Chloroflexi bacterium]|nr:MAG: hypothetical protein DRI46_12150 [Chloroflexota bacterium]